jgi:hypothetical protein
MAILKWGTPAPARCAAQEQQSAAASMVVSKGLPRDKLEVVRRLAEESISDKPKKAGTPLILM